MLKCICTASANAASAFALELAFDCPVMDAFALELAFDSSAFAFVLAFDSNAFDQMRNKCESNATLLLLFYNFILLVDFAWNKHQEDQYKNL